MYKPDFSFEVVINGLFSVYTGTTKLNVFADTEYIGIITRYDSTHNVHFIILSMKMKTKETLITSFFSVTFTRLKTN